MQTEIDTYLLTIKTARSEKTYLTYQIGLMKFVELVGDDAPLTIETYMEFLDKSNKSAMLPTTKQTYRAAVRGFLSFYALTHPDKINVASFPAATRQYVKREYINPPIVDRDVIEKIITYFAGLRGDLPTYRDRAFVLTLADTGLRISEACSLRRGDMDWNELRAVVVGKGNKQAVVRFSARSIEAIQDYLRERIKLDGASKKPLSTLPLFARHDISASKHIKPIKSGGMWRSIKDRIELAGFERDVIRIHDFRHYFVTTVLLSTGNMKTAQELARHARMDTTGRYAHLTNAELDQAYREIFK